VTHLHSFFPGLLGRLGPLPARVVYQPHSWAFAAGPASARRLVVALERRALRHCDIVVVNCAAECDEARRHGIFIDPHVVGVPLDVRRFAAHDFSRPPQLRRMGAASAIVCVGRISAQKGQVELVRAWERAPVAGAVLVLVGPGGSEKLRVAAPTEFGRSVLHVGAQLDVRPFLRHAAVGVMASRYEGQSVAMAETLACGVPMVMTDVNGAREAVAPSDDRAAGAVVPVGELDLLLAEAARRVHDPALRAREAAWARANALELFDPASVLRRVMTAYAGGKGVPARTAGAA
jgi:glycosyltransferase involved in cell wall biosynthesis